MAELFKNLASTTLNGDINDAVTSLVVASAMGFTSGDFRILIDSEIMKVSGVSGTTFTVARAQEGTAAASHTNATAVSHVLTAAALDAHDQNDLASCDTYANRPAAGTPGRIFLPTDGIFIERDNGSTWDKFGPIWPMTPAVAADFPAWVSQGTSTCVDNKGAMFLRVPNNATATLSCRMKAYPTPPFTVEMGFIPTALPMGASNLMAGLVIRDSVTGKMQGYGVGGTSNEMQLVGANYSLSTTYYSAITGWPTLGSFSCSSLIWLKYYDDNASARVISVSVDGYTWSQLVSLSRTDYCTPDQIGVAVEAKTGYSSSWGAIDTGLTLMHWRQY